MGDTAADPFVERALRVIGLAFGGPSKVGGLLWRHRIEFSECEFTVPPHVLATWDDGALTRLVVAAHDECVRASLRPKRLRIIVRLISRTRTQEEPVDELHPTLEAHVAAIRGDLAAICALRKSMTMPAKNGDHHA